MNRTCKAYEICDRMRSLLGEFHNLPQRSILRRSDIGTT